MTLRCQAWAGIPRTSTTTHQRLVMKDEQHVIEVGEHYEEVLEGGIYESG
jgi:hypothetical protein